MAVVTIVAAAAAVPGAAVGAVHDAVGIAPRRAIRSGGGGGGRAVGMAAACGLGLGGLVELLEHQREKELRGGELVLEHVVERRVGLQPYAIETEGCSRMWLSAESACSTASTASTASTNKMCLLRRYLLWLP